MDNKLIVGPLLMIILMGSVFKSHAESTLTIDDRAKLGEVYSLERLRQFDQAKPLIKDLYHRYGDDREIAWSYVRILGFGGQWKEATKAFDVLCAVRCNEDKFVTYAHILEAQGPDPQTIIFIKKLADQHPSLKKIQSIYTEILTWNVQNPQGQQVIEELYMKYPDDLKITKADVDILVEQKKYTEAMAQMNNLISRNPDDLDLRYQHAQVVSAMGDHAGAVKEFQELFNDGFKKKETAILLGDELRLLGRDEEALKVYQGVINEK